MIPLRWMAVAALPLGLSLAGCSAAPLTDAGGSPLPLSDVQRRVADRLPPQASVRPWSSCQVTAAAAGGPACGPEDAAATAALDALLAHPLAADDAVMVALLRAPSLQAVYADLGIAEADLVQAGLLRNPVFTVSTALSVAGPGPARLGGGLVGDFLDLLWRPARVRLAADHRDAVMLGVAAAVADHAAAVRAAYWRYRAALALAAVADDGTRLAAAADGVMDGLKRAGNVNERTRLGTAVTLADAEADNDAASADAEAARQDLARLMGIAGGAPWQVPADLPPPTQDVPPADTVLARVRAGNLELAAARQDLLTRQRALDLADRQRLFPSLEAGVAVERDRDQGWGLGPQLSLPLPLFDQGQGTLSRAAAEYRQGAAQAAALADRLNTAALEQRARMTAGLRQARRDLSQVIPTHSRLVALTLRDYNAMLASPFDVLAAKAGETAARRHAITAQRDYWLARTELERLAGPLPAPPQSPDHPASQEGAAS